MGRNLFDFNIANSSNLFLSGKVATDDQLGSVDAPFSSARSTASSSAESLANQTSSTVVTQATDMDTINHSLAMQHSRAADYSSRGNRKPMTFTTTSSITGTNTTTIVAGGHQHHAAVHVPNANGSAECKARKKCSVCGKSFNPLRRRHYCRTCTAVVCSSCSISRRVESTFEGAITVRMCVSCKLSSIASQDDFYDRIFSTNGGANPTGTTESLPSGSEEDFTTDRLSFASYSSGTGNGSNASKDELSMGTASSNMVDSQGSMDKRAASSSNLPVRRKSSTTSGSGNADAAAGARGRHGSFIGPPAVTENCPWCMNEACAPLHEYFEVPYPFFLELADPSAKNQYIAAKHLDDEKERLRSVRTIRGALKTGTSALQTIMQLCNMAAIATSSPMALVGLLDKHVYVPCAESGLGSLDKIDRQKSLAAHACRNGSPLVCSDLTRDVRFAANPWRRDMLQAQFYAGIPLTMSNGHTIGAIEVFDVIPRFACMDVISQMQTVVRGLLRKFEEILAKNPASGEEGADAPLKSSSSSGRRAPKSESGEGKKRTPRAPAPSAPIAPAIPPPKKSPKPQSRAAAASPLGPAPQPPKPTTTKEAPQAAPAAPAQAAAPARGGEPSQEDMETQLMQLLSQTTCTQEQLRNQQGQMVSAISSHSKQINDLAKQLERMESTLAAKLSGDADDGEDSLSNEDANAATA